VAVWIRETPKVHETAKDKLAFWGKWTQQFRPNGCTEHNA
jgi:hypothetical protein